MAHHPLLYKYIPEIVTEFRILDATKYHGINASLAEGAPHY
jgi:hypothetical protein